MRHLAIAAALLGICASAIACAQTMPKNEGPKTTLPFCENALDERVKRLCDLNKEEQQVRTELVNLNAGLYELGTRMGKMLQDLRSTNTRYVQASTEEGVALTEHIDRLNRDLDEASRQVSRVRLEMQVRIFRLKGIPHIRGFMLQDLGLIPGGENGK